LKVAPITNWRNCLIEKLDRQKFGNSDRMKIDEHPMHQVSLSVQTLKETLPSIPMSHTKLLSIISLLNMAGIAIVGCGASSQSEPSANLPLQKSHSVTQGSDPDATSSRPYVTCRARISALEESYRWFDDNSAGHDDGVAPLASLVLTEPALYRGHTIGILFKYTGDADTATPPEQADIGSQFTFQIPKEALTGKYRTIDNTQVRHFAKITP
jgi:hypothetical protein